MVNLFDGPIFSIQGCQSNRICLNNQYLVYIIHIYYTHEYLKLFSQHQNKLLFNIVHLFQMHVIPSHFHSFVFIFLIPLFCNIFSLLVQYSDSIHFQNLVFLSSQIAFIPRSNYSFFVSFPPQVPALQIVFSLFILQFGLNDAKK